MEYPVQEVQISEDTGGTVCNRSISGTAKNSVDAAEIIQPHNYAMSNQCQTATWLMKANACSAALSIIENALYVARIAPHVYTL